MQREKIEVKVKVNVKFRRGGVDLYIFEKPSYTTLLASRRGPDKSLMVLQFSYWAVMIIRSFKRRVVMLEKHLLDIRSPPLLP
jgi:hypothetical protein